MGPVSDHPIANLKPVRTFERGGLRQYRGCSFPRKPAVGNRKSVEIAVFPVLGACQRSGQHQALLTEVMHDHAVL